MGQSSSTVWSDEEPDSFSADDDSEDDFHDENLEKNSEKEKEEGKIVVTCTPDLEERPSNRSKKSTVIEVKERNLIDPESATDEYLKSKLSDIIITREVILKTIVTNPDEIDLYADSEIRHKISKQKMDRINLYTNIALMILKLSDLIKDLRFQLVPAKISEGKFWNAVFHLLDIRITLQNGGDDEIVNNKNTCDVDSSMKETLISSGKCVEIISDETKNSGKILEDEIDIESLSKEELRVLLKQKENEISQLRSLLVHTPSDNRSKLNGSKKHNGKWIMNQDSIDFLELDDEIKRNLRAEKQKRLNEVRDQMKFILDSDDVRDTTGTWDCCNQTLYDGECFT